MREEGSAEAVSRVVAVAVGGAGTEDVGGGLVAVPSDVDGEAGSDSVAEPSVATGGVVVALRSAVLGAMVDGGVLGDAPGVSAGAGGEGFVAGWGRIWLGSTRVGPPGNSDSPTAIPATARTEPTARCAARVRRRERTPARRRSRCVGSKGAGSSVSRINCASCCSK
jgi:hypothetical protein